MKFIFSRSYISITHNTYAITKSKREKESKRVSDRALYQRIKILPNWAIRTFHPLIRLLVSHVEPMACSAPCQKQDTSGHRLLYHSLDISGGAFHARVSFSYYSSYSVHWHHYLFFFSFFFLLSFLLSRVSTYAPSANHLSPSSKEGGDYKTSAMLAEL